MTRTLDQSLLERLEASWRKEGAEIADALAPGLTESEIDGLVEPLGLRLPKEARLWWGWHNGVTVETARGWDIGPDIGFFSLAQAVAELDEYPLSGGNELAPPTWLPLAYAPGGYLALDSAGPDLAPVQRVDIETGFLAGAESMGDLVALWIETIEAGAWSWNPAGYWDKDLDRAPERAANMYVI
jgi:cell wall assembly regulator SMI1